MSKYELFVTFGEFENDQDELGIFHGDNDLITLDGELIVKTIDDDDYTFEIYKRDDGHVFVYNRYCERLYDLTFMHENNRCDLHTILGDSYDGISRAGFKALYLAQRKGVDLFELATRHAFCVSDGKLFMGVFLAGSFKPISLGANFYHENPDIDTRYHDNEFGFYAIDKGNESGELELFVINLRTGESAPVSDVTDFANNLANDQFDQFIKLYKRVNPYDYEHYNDNGDL